jgi:hypothetical protein
VDQSPRGFATEDEEATYCLSLLRDGDRHQKIRARERLSQIFERRGLLDEAAQCLESNIREGVRDPRVYQRLAGVYRRQGRHELADEVLIEARRLAERLSRSAPGAWRPGRPPGRPTTPVPGPLEAPTAPLPASGPPPGRADPRTGATGGELELDRVGAGAPPAGASDARASTVKRPWWLSPPMLVLLLLLCGSFGLAPFVLALMWVRGGYSRQVNARVTAICAGLTVLSLGAAAVVLQPRIAAIVGMVGTTGVLGTVPALGAAPTPIVFGTPGAVASPAPAAPPGLAAASPTSGVAPAASATRPAGVMIGPGPTNEASPIASPAAGSAPTASAAAGERLKVIDTGGEGANLRERPGSTGPVIKTVPDGTVLQVIGADQAMDGKSWRNVRDDDGAQGWMAAELLAPAS